MNVLVACEESQRVTTQFRRLGHNAFSCDIIDQSGGHPEWHIKADVLPLLNGHCWFKTMDEQIHILRCKWDMIIAFPPCTYLTNAGARHLWKGHKLNEERYAKGLAAKEFFMQFYNADCDKVAIENPTPSRIYELPEKNAGNSAVSIRASVYETNTVMAERAAKVGADRHSGAGKNVLPIRQLFRQA